MNAYLLLSDGQVFKGKAIGADGTVIGEVVFNTSMTGYQEIMTDPSYYGQMVVFTYPLIGNYGVNENYNESEGQCIRGAIMREICEKPNNYMSQGTLEDYMKKNNIVGISQIDTRAVTKRIRQYGVMNGAIIHGDDFDKDELLSKIKAYSIANSVQSVTVSGLEIFKPDNIKYRIGLFDYGYKEGILNNLLQRGAEVTILPADMSAEEVLKMDFDGIMLSNGPGDPQENTEIIKQLRILADSKIPVFGICLGHQMLALAYGADSIKLKFGHRGGNQPVKDLTSGKTYITSQNHGYAIVPDSLDPDKQVMTHINLNDNTLEGIEYKGIPAFTIQFHPEANPGPQDTSYLFDRFINMIEQNNH